MIDFSGYTEATVSPFYDPDASIVIMDGDDYKSVTAAQVAHIYKYNGSLKTLNQRHSQNIVALEEYLKENIEDLDDHAEEIAKIFDLELTKELTVHLTFTVEATVSVPVNYEVDEDDFQLSLSESNTDMELLDWNVENTECSVDDRF